MTSTGATTFVPSEPPAVAVGDRLGTYTEGTGVIPYTNSEADPADSPGEIDFTANNSGPPTEGQPLGTVDSPRDRTYSFGGTIRPATKDQCKDGGWRAYGVFENQGDCVSYVATGARNAPAGL